MIRNMDLVRKILIAVEEQYEDTVIYNLQIEGYDRKEVAYHCKILHSGNLISNYDGQFTGDEIYSTKKTSRN